MDKSFASDWTLIQAFLAVADCGSLSSAARRTGQSQPTLGRQIRQLEQNLNASLFTRHARGLALSAHGQAILPHARKMQAAMRDIDLTVAGRDADLSGTVRITASQVVAQYILPSVIAALRQDYPTIAIELVATDSTDNLLFREADIAVRMYRPQQLDIVARHLGGIRISVCAAQSYLDRHGVPQTVDDLRHHALVGYDRSDLILQGMQALGVTAIPEWFATRCDDQPTYLELVRAGCGIGFMQEMLIRRDPMIRTLDLGFDIPPLPVWLAAPSATRHTPRVALVWTALEQGLAPFIS